MTKKKSGPKRQNRVPIYPRVSRLNQAWLRTMAKKAKHSEAVIVDRLLTASRRKMGITAIRKLLDGKA